MGVIHDCQERGFHPHKAPLDGSPIYEQCSHVYMDTDIKFDMIDLRDDAAQLHSVYLEPILQAVQQIAALFF